MTEQTETRPVPNLRANGPVHRWFELTYSSYQVMPRVLMQSMPIDWQVRMVALLDEMRDAFRDVEKPDEYRVEPVRWASVNDLSDEERTLAGVTVAWDGEEGEGEPTYYHRGVEVDHPDIDRIGVPIVDTLPGYRHGFVMPTIPDAPERGTKVISIDVQSGDTETVVIEDDFVVITDGNLAVTTIGTHANGTAQVTLKRKS